MKTMKRGQYTLLNKYNDAHLMFLFTEDLSLINSDWL